MDTLLQELRYSARRLLNTPAFTAIVVVTLALGIGANTAIFSVVNVVLLRSLPFKEPDRLVTIEHFYPSLHDLKAPVSAPGFAAYRDRTHSFASMAIETGWNVNLTGNGEPERLQGSRVSGLFFPAVGVPAASGRVLSPDEDVPGRNRVVVLSDGLWRRLFAADPHAVGKTMQLNGETYDIVGIMPPTFRDVFGRSTELWTPLALPPAQYTDLTNGNEWLSLVARLKPGTSLEGARAEMRAFAGEIKRLVPNAYPNDWSLLVTALNEKATGAIRPALLVLLGAVGFVLLIACANVANLLLARAATRRKELAIRTALGAKRWHLVRQLLTESVLLAFVGGVLGLLLAYWGVRTLVALNPGNLPNAKDIGIDGTVMSFTLAISLLTGLLFGLVPALQTAKDDLHVTLKEGGRSSSTDVRGQTLRRVLVVAEVGLALTLLVGAGLLIKSFARLQQVDTGFNPSNLLTLNLSLPRVKYASDTQQIAFFDQVLTRVAAIPGVRAVGATSELPFGRSWSTRSFNIEGLQVPPNQPGPWGDFRAVSTDFFRALGAPLLRGRAFTDADAAGAPPVAIVDDEVVTRYWPGQNPIGKRISFGDPASPQTRWIEVVGVVRHTKHEGLDAESRVQVYVPYRQRATVQMSLAVRTAGDPLSVVASVRNAVHSVDRDQPLSQVSAMTQLVESSVGQRRLSMLLLGLFAGIALLLASIGIYGVMSYSVTQRTHELGVRMALGAEQRNVLGLVVRQGMTLALIGVVVGLFGAFALTRLIASQLYHVGATDPVTFILVATLLSAIALVATLLPAMRATRVDPVIALREE